MSTSPLPRPRRYIDKRQLLEKVPLSYVSIWKRMKSGEFPAPYVHGNKNNWDEDEVDSYLASRPRRDGYPGIAASAKREFPEHLRKKLADKRSRRLARRKGARP